MKKILTAVIVAALCLGAAASDRASAEGEDAADSVLAQVQANKEKNNEKSEEKEAGEDKAKESSEAESAKAEAAETKEEAQGTKTNEAAAALDQIVKEAAESAAQEQAASANNKGVVNETDPRTSEAESAASSAADTAAASTAAASKDATSADAAATPAPTVVIPTQEDTVVSTPSSSASEVPADRPLKPTALSAGAAETKESLVVTVDWLKANLSKVIVIDARPDSLYNGGHIPGAVNAPWTYFANTNTKQGTIKWGVIWSEATMAKRLGALGINGNKQVVAYCDAGGWGQSGWTLWILRQAGIKNAKILEGGMSAWKAAGGQVSKTASKNKTVSLKIDKYVANYGVTTEWLNNNLGKPGLVIIDVRTDSEYLGKIRPFQEKRAGHIPGAVHMPREAFLNDDNTFKSADEVKALLAADGITPESEIVVYDTAGVRSAFVTMILRYGGFLKSMNYDEGFQAWAGDETLPLVTQ